MTEVVAVIKTIGEIISGVREIIAFVRESQNEQWWKDWTDARQSLRSATNAEERKDAARKIRESLAGL